MDSKTNWFDQLISTEMGNNFISKDEEKNTIKNMYNKTTEFKPYIESSSSSTTHISENICISESVSISENFQNNIIDGEEWTNSFESCLSKTLDGTFGKININCPQEASSQESLEEQLNYFFAQKFGSPKQDYGRGVQEIEEKAQKQNIESQKGYSESQLCANKEMLILPEGTIANTTNQIMINRIQNENKFNIIPTKEKLTQKSENKNIYVPEAYNGLNINEPCEIINSANEYSIKGTQGSCTSASSIVNRKFSNSSNLSFNTNIVDHQLSGSFLEEIFPNNEFSSGLSEVDNTYDPYETIKYFNKDMINTINQSNYKTTQGNKEIDLTFNKMDTLSRVDNLLNKDVADFTLPSKEFTMDLITDYSSEVVNGDMLNNDALFSEIYRDDVDDSDVWDNLMKRLCISSNINYTPSLMNEVGINSSSSSIKQNNEETPEMGINFKHKDNMPTILPSDPNLGFKKTSLCKYWQRGICANDDCNFAHGKKELRSTIGVWRTTICHHWKTGICRVGKDCRHAHGEEELQPKNIPPNVLKNKLLNSARKYEYIRKKKNTY